MPMVAAVGMSTGIGEHKWCQYDVPAAFSRSALALLMS